MLNYRTMRQVTDSCEYNVFADDEEPLYQRKLAAHRIAERLSEIAGSRRPSYLRIAMVKASRAWLHAETHEEVDRLFFLTAEALSNTVRAA